MDIFWLEKKIFKGNKIVKYLNLKNRHLIVFLPLLGLSYWIYHSLFLRWFSYDVRFFPTFLLGVISLYITQILFRE